MISTLLTLLSILPAQAPPLVPPPAPIEAAPTPTIPVPDEVLRAYAALAANADPDGALFVQQSLINSTITRDAWHEMFQRYYQERPFVPNESAFWSSLLSQPDLYNAAFPAAAASAAEAVAALARLPLDSGAQELAIALQPLFDWLNTLRRNLPREAQPEMLEAFDAALQNNKLPVQQALRLLSGNQTAGHMVNTLLHLAAWPNTRVANWATAPSSLDALYSCCGIVLLDNETLQPTHVESLKSLYRNIPPDVHGVSVIIAANALGIPPEAITPPAGYAVVTEALPMTQLLGTEQLLSTTHALVPQFTLLSAERLLAAIELHQTTFRPDLAPRLQLLLGRPQPTADPAFAQSATPLARAFSLWIADSTAAWDYAVAQSEQASFLAAELFLFVADLLSAGRAETISFKTAVEGIVTTTSATLGRTQIAPDVSLPVGLQISGAAWQLQYDAQGTPISLGRQ